VDVKKFALITFGNEESYGLIFVGGELLLYNQTIKYFDAEQNDVEELILFWNPDYICFSPMTVFYSKSLQIARNLKRHIPNITSIFGGHHPTSFPEIIKDDGVDIVVVGPVRSTIEKIIAGEKGIIKSKPVSPADLPEPARKEYYNDIPRMTNRYRKIMMSMFGCPWNCAYCSSSSNHLREIYGKKIHKNYFLRRRPIDSIVDEAKQILSLGITAEIEWGDDDIFTGTDIEQWLPNFVKIWKNEIDIPIYVMATSVSVLKASDHLLSELKKIVNCVGMGVQAIRSESLKLVNRAWDSESKMKQAYQRLVSFGFSVNLQAIVGLPVEDPVEDAIDTILGLQRIAPGSICSVYPLIVFPGTDIEKRCNEKNLPFNDLHSFDTNAGIPSIDYPLGIQKKLRNICKLGTFFVKYNIDERWLRPLIDIDFDDSTSRVLSMNKYYECVVDRLKDKGAIVFDEIRKTSNIRF